MTDYNNFQRVGSPHNSGVGRSFEDKARLFFASQGLELQRNLKVAVGVSTLKRFRQFDLGSESPRVLVECKSHTWTSGGNTPSAKMTVWNEAMYYFHIAPADYRKIMFVLKHDRKETSLATYYLRTHGHLVPEGVEFWEYNAETQLAVRLR